MGTSSATAKVAVARNTTDTASPKTVRIILSIHNARDWLIGHCAVTNPRLDKLLVFQRADYDPGIVLDFLVEVTRGCGLRCAAPNDPVLDCIV